MYPLLFSLSNCLNCHNNIWYRDEEAKKFYKIIRYGCWVCGSDWHPDIAPPDQLRELYGPELETRQKDHEEALVESGIHDARLVKRDGSNKAKANKVRKAGSRH